MPKSFLFPQFPPEDFDRSADFIGPQTPVANQEGVANSSENNLGFGAFWTVTTWVNTRQNASFSLGQQILRIRELVGNENAIFIEYHDQDDTGGPGHENPLQIFNHDSSGGVIKFYRWDNLFPLNTWVHLGITFKSDGIFPSVLTLYKDGVLVVPDLKSTDNNTVSTNTNRRLDIGARVDSGVAVIPWNGLIGNLAMWDVQLDADNIAEIFNPSDGNPPLDMDLTINLGDYDQKNNLIHFYRNSSRDIMLQDREGSINLTGVNMDTSDISNNTPV